MARRHSTFGTVVVILLVCAALYFVFKRLGGISGVGIPGLSNFIAGHNSGANATTASAPASQAVQPPLDVNLSFPGDISAVPVNMTGQQLLDYVGGYAGPGDGTEGDPTLG